MRNTITATSKLYLATENYLTAKNLSFAFRQLEILPDNFFYNLPILAKFGSIGEKELYSLFQEDAAQLSLLKQKLKKVSACDLTTRAIEQADFLKTDIAEIYLTSRGELFKQNIDGTEEFAAKKANSKQISMLLKQPYPIFIDSGIENIKAINSHVNSYNMPSKGLDESQIEKLEETLSKPRQDQDFWQKHITKNEAPQLIR